MQTHLGSDYGKWTVTQLAVEFNISQNIVTRRLLAAGLTPIGTSGKRPTYRVGYAAEAILFPEKKKAMTLDVDDLQPRDRLDHYKAENERVKFGRETSLLVEVDDARAEMATVAKSGLHILETLRDALESDFDLSQEIIDSVQAKVDALRSQWADMLLIPNDVDMMLANVEDGDLDDLIEAEAMEKEEAEVKEKLLNAKREHWRDKKAQAIKKKSEIVDGVMSKSTDENDTKTPEIDQDSIENERKQKELDEKLEESGELMTLDFLRGKTD
ncbi:MAG: DUF1441 family protein [Candidatus Scalindua sp.]|nr:DUF1441 family protein [Candidatus Scalindua sp.]